MTSANQKGSLFLIGTKRAFVLTLALGAILFAGRVFSSAALAVRKRGNHQMRLSSVVLGVTLVLALEACTHQSTAPVSNPSEPERSSSSRPMAVDLPKASQEIESPIELPFARYFDAANRLTAAASRSQGGARALLFDNRQAFVAQCMSQEGFEYYPQEYTSPTQMTEDTVPYYLGSKLAIPWLPETRKEVEQVGYGVLSLAEWPGAEQWHNSVSSAAKKNETYLASLSPAAREAYQLALTGYPGTDVPNHQNSNSCFDQADVKYPDMAPPDLSFLDPLLTMQRFFNWAVSVTPDGSIVDDPEAARLFPDSVYGNPEVMVLQEEYRACVTESVIKNLCLNSMENVIHNGVLTEKLVLSTG